VNGAPERPGRPAGVTVLGWFFLMMGVVLLASAVGSAAARPAQAAGLAGAARLVLGLALPAVWSGTAGWGRLKGRAWARSLVAAMAVLALVIVAGTVSAVGRSPEGALVAGKALGLLAVTGGASGYLFSDRARHWLR